MSVVAAASSWVKMNLCYYALLDPFSLLAVTVVTSFCADYCKYHSFFFIEKSVDSMSFAFSGRLDWGICWTLFCSKIFYRYDFVTHSCKWNAKSCFSVKLKYPFNLGKYTRTCHFYMDDYEKQDGDYDHYLRRKLDCEYLFNQAHLNFTYNSLCK